MSTDCIGSITRGRARGNFSCCQLPAAAAMLSTTGHCVSYFGRALENGACSKMQRPIARAWRSPIEQGWQTLQIYVHILGGRQLLKDGDGKRWLGGFWRASTWRASTWQAGLIWAERKKGSSHVLCVHLFALNANRWLSYFSILRQLCTHRVDFPALARTFIIARTLRHDHVCVGARLPPHGSTTNDLESTAKASGRSPIPNKLDPHRVSVASKFSRGFVRSSIEEQPSTNIYIRLFKFSNS